MIDLYTFMTPNGFKASIALEELSLPYEVHRVNISHGDQHKAEYLAINPNSKIPAIVDREGPGGGPFTVIESGAILLYLAEKTGKLLPSDPRGRSEAIQWLMFQMGGVGPMFGQYGHFANFAPQKIPYAIERYTKERDRLLGVLNVRLAQHLFLGGAAYSVADIATYPWVVGLSSRNPGMLSGSPHVQRWVDEVGSRPAVQKGMKTPS